VRRGRVRGAASEKDVSDERLEDFIVSWPGRWPKGKEVGMTASKHNNVKE
jgi:hypothetical protein